MRVVFEPDLSGRLWEAESERRVAFEDERRVRFEPDPQVGFESERRVRFLQPGGGVLDGAKNA